ncbi:DUF5776 domain-containing protein [Apilactobacillus timberlakei]|uniref:DUF5776 domain-containing protein n=1 Tax=Apilactobacillus timberlakei TaxID=2008380 RepID=UPI00112EEE1B|nr:DUF5776 domain-containing protein [Apilactobacillus timberlakei]TPR13086.1 hypothetical protein DYZ97_04160 [Apilactobacillus timberlakei]
MQYNKRDIKKINDKKMMRKVKKQWVVLSVAAFAALGASAFEMLNPNETIVHADDQSISTKITSVGRNQNASNSTPVHTSTTLLSDKVATPSSQPVDEPTKAQNNWNNGQKDNTDNSADYKNTYNNSTQGFKDAMNNDSKNVVQSQNSNTPTNPNPSKSDSGYQNGVSQYNQNRSAMNAGAADAFNGNSENTSTQTSDNAKNYYDAAYNGSNDAKAAYNNATKNEGTNTNSYTSYNQWLKDNNKSQNDTPTQNKQNATDYQKNIDGNLNTANNASVQSNNSKIQVTQNSSISGANAATYANNKKYATDSGYALAYQYGYNYFLANQGVVDAKSGKWNGQTKNNSGGTTAASYLPSAGSSNPYDQAYLGAQAAINSQVNQTQSGTNGTTISNYTGSGNSNMYQSAYNDVANDTQKGIVYLSNSGQMDNVLQNNMNNVTALKLVNDVMYPDSSNSQGYPRNTVNINNNLNIDGQNHLLDITNNNYNFQPNNMNMNINIHNFKTLYGSNYWGPFSIVSNGSDNKITSSSIIYSNFNYVGSKLVSSYNSDVYINGNVNIDQVDTYTSPVNSSVQTQTSGNHDNGGYGNGGNYQPGLQVGNMILGVNANYFGSSASQTGSQNVQVNGNLTLGTGSNMTLVPTGAANGQDSPDNNNYSVYLKNQKSILNVNNNASLNIFLNNDNGNQTAGIYNLGTINVNGGTINAESNSAFANGSNQMIYSNGKINVTNGGLINVKVSNLGSTTSSGIINNQNSINISNLGNLSVQDIDNSGGAITLVGGQPLNIYNVGDSGVTLINNKASGSQFTNGGINAYTVTVSNTNNNQNPTAYYNFNMDSNGNATVLGVDGVKNTLSLPGNSLYINSVPSVSFIGPIYTTNDQGVTTIHGYAKISKYSSAAGNLYVQYAYGNNAKYSKLNQFDNQPFKNDKYQNVDNNNYYHSIVPSQNDLIPLSFQVPNGTNASSYGIRLRYGVSGVNAVVTTNKAGNQSYTANTEGYSSNDGQLQESDVQSASGQLNSSNDGVNNGISDIETNSSNAKVPTKYQKDLDYTNAYDSAQSGYKYYMDNSGDPNNQEDPHIPSIPDKLNVTDPGAFSKGYCQAAKDLHQGYMESLNGNNLNALPSESDNVGNKLGFSQGQSVLQGISDANNNPNQGDSYSGNDIQRTAYKAAVNAIKAGINNDPIQPDLGSQPQVYQDAYNKAYKDAQNTATQIAKNGGNTDGITLTPAQQAAQNTAQQAMNQATTDAQTADSSKNDQYKGDTNADKTYQGAQAGYANGGTDKPASDDPVYKNAFDKAQTAAKAAANTGAQSYVDGNNTNNPTEGTATERAADNYGYQQAQQGYNAAKANPNTIDQDKYKNNPSYKSGVDMNTAVNNGANDANKATSKNPNYANSHHNAAQTAGYNGTLDGGQAGMNGDPKPDLSNQSQAYQDAYNRAYDSGKQTAAKIASGDIDPSNLSPGQQAAYNNSPQAVAKASDAAKNPNTESDSKYSGTDNASRAYQAAKAGYANGGTGTMMPTQKSDPIYSKAFTDAQTAAKAAANTGAQSYVNGNNTNNPNEGTAAERTADDYGYQQAKAGYNDAKANPGQVNQDKYKNDPSYKAGVDMNNSVNAGVSDANNATTKDPSYANSHHNAAQTAGYNGTLDGGQAGMNGDPIPSDLNTKPQAYQDAYNKAYQDAQQQAQQIADDIAKGEPADTSKLTPAQNKAYQAAQQAIDNAKSAAADNNPTVNDSKYSGTNNASRAYQAAKAGYANGGTGTMTPTQKSDPIYSKAFTDAQTAAKAAANTGAQSYVNGNNTNNPTEGTAAEKAADNYGYQQAQAGYDAQRKGHFDNDKYTNDPSYKAGVQVANDVSNGSQAATQSNNPDPNYYPVLKNDNVAEKDAYQATKAAYQAAMNGTGKADNNNKSQAYRDAYDSAYQDANKQADAINKGNITSDRLTPGQKAAYNQAQNAMNAAINDAKNNPDANNDKYSGTDNASRAYQAAKAGYANAGNNTMDSNYNDDPVYKNAFNQAQNDARSQAAQAVKDFADGKDNNNQNGSNALGKAYDQGYNEMKAGYDGKPSTSGNDNDPSYQAGVQMAKDVKAGTTDAYDNPKQGTSYQGSLAKQEAYQATVEANKDASSEKPKSKPDASDFIRNSRSYQDAYNNAYNHAAQMTKAAAAGQIDKNNLDNQLDRDAYNQGINDYQEGYQAAQAGNPSDGSKYKGKGIADLAYQGAQAGFNDGAKNLNEPKSEDPVYVNAYQNARDAARKYAKSGAQDFAQGTFKNSGASDPDEHDDSNNQDALNKAHDYGYNQAQSGYDAQQANKNKDLTNNGTPEYNIGAKMARDSDLGKKFALTGTGDSIANSDIAQRDGYQATINGYQDGANGHKQSLDGHSKAYIDAYNQAYEDGQKLAQQGASGKTDDVGLLQNNQPGQKAYAQGISDANSGYQAAVNQNGTNDDGKHSDINDSNVDKAYQGALAGLKDVGNGVNQPNNSDPVYVKAYNDANQVARSAIQAGVNEFAHGDDSSTTSEHNDPVSMAHNQGFDQAKQGYQDQMSGKADSANKNPGYIAGVQMAEEYQKAIDNTNNSPGQDGNNDPVSQATRAATLAGYSDSIHNINNSTTPNQYQSQSKVYQDAYSKAHQEAINNLKAGAEAFNNDNVAPTGNDIASMAKEQGFAAAQDAYKKAQQNSTVTPQSTDGSNYSETYNGASTAFNNALKGNYDQPNSSSDVYNSAYKKAMKEAKQLISDAAMNNIKNQNGTGSSNLSNNMISKLSDLGMNDASQAYQAAQDQNSSYTSTNPNATDVYNGAKAAFDDIKNGNANKQHDSGNDLYQASYAKALQDAQKYAQMGADGYSNGNNSVDDILNNIVKPSKAEIDAVNTGFNQAKAGHDDSMSGVAQPKQDNPYYNYEFENSAKSNQAGTKAAMDDATQGNEHTGNDKLDQAYQGTVDAYNNHGELPNGFDHMPVAYRDAFNAAKDKAKQAYQSGADQFNNDQPNTETNNKGATALAHNNGYQAAQSIYNQVLQNPNAVDSSNLDPAQKAGYEKAQQAIAGLQDYASGKQPTNTDSNYMAGYNIAKQATQAALNDARNGKPAQNDNVPSGMNPKLYQDIYNATYSGYNNGYNGSDNKADQGFAYKIAYQNAYKQGQYDIPAPVMPATNTAKPNRNSNKQAKQSANVDQFTNQGIADALNGNKMKNKASTYRTGYRLGNDAIKGMRAAEYGKRAKKNIKNANDSFYMFGYNGYKAGVRAAKRTLNANKHLNKHDLVGKSQAYVYAFKQGQKAETRYQHNWGAKQGAAMARKHHATPISLNKTHSAAYVKSYMEAYRRTMKRVMPRYIYNIRTIFVHSKTKFTKHNRVIRYVKKPRYAAKILKVTGIAYYKNGTPRYRVRGGGIIADKHGTGLVTTDGVVNAYYRHNFKRFRVIKPVGTLVHKGLKFDRSNVTRKVYHGEIFTVNKVVRYHGLTRFYLGHGEYITSNKTFVKKVG